MKERERKRLQRQKKKVLKVKLGQSAFKNRQVKGKAMKKLSRALVTIRCSQCKSLDCFQRFFKRN